MSYVVKFNKAADKEIAKLLPKLQLEILHAVEELQTNPRPHGYKKLASYHSERAPNKLCYRVKIKKDYRIIFTIEEEIITITIIKVKHRKEVYK
jgi:mRNA interferase RelE/StbE